MRQTKNVKPFFALAESLPTFAILIHSEHQCARMVTRIRHYESYDKSVTNCCNVAPLRYKGPGAASLWNIIEVVLSELWACQGG